MARYSFKQLKQVKAHWEAEVCATRGISAENPHIFFTQVADSRYKIERHIFDFADFTNYEGCEILEIGVGAGSDFCNWVLAGAHATGVDLTEASISLTSARLALENVPRDRYKLFVGNAERLPLPGGRYDLVYSYGVLHHSPNTEAALKEAYRVLKSGGTLKIMVYAVPSWTGLMLWLWYGLFAGKPFSTQKDVIFRHLESPGTKAYRPYEMKTLLEEIGFTDIRWIKRLSNGDLLAMPPSQKYQGGFYRIVWALYPRWIVRALGDRWGLYLLITAEKPSVYIGSAFSSGGGVIRNRGQCGTR